MSRKIDYTNQGQHHWYFASTPTTVASAAPEFNPKRLIATATASSKKFEVPIMAAGAAIITS